MLRGAQTLQIAANYFSPREVQDLFRLPNNRQLGRFFDLWTLKEAYIKAFGLGRAMPLTQARRIDPVAFRSSYGGTDE